MKRFFNFLLLVFLLALLVGGLQLWKARREGRSISGPLSRFFDPDAGRRHPEKYTLADGPSVNLKDVDVLAAMSRQRILLAKAVVPSVVSITTSKNMPRPRQQDAPFFDFFHPRGMQMPVERELGSGVIVSKEGHIITNNHVIEGMDEIQVELSDSRPKRARLIGTDPTTDIAVLKIDASDLKPIAFGDSDQVEVGETVLAVGNPFGLEESVTQGIISAKGRASETLSDLFQTDAQINPGNSGGPLINVRGELIGINEAIYSQTGSFQGVGFAIPSATVRRTMDSILKLGRVVHGYLGVNLQPLTPQAAKELGLPDANGALVDGVVPESPAEHANIQKGDFIRKFNGKPVNDIQSLRRAVAEVDVNFTAPVELLRNGQTLTLNATIAERQSEMSVAPSSAPQPRFHSFGGGGNNNNNNGGGGDLSPAVGGALGAVQIADVNPAILRHLGLPPSLRGVLVQNVVMDSPAARSLQVGDVIQEIESRPVSSLIEYGQIAAKLPVGEPVILTIVRGGTRKTVVVQPE